MPNDIVLVLYIQTWHTHHVITVPMKLCIIANYAGIILRAKGLENYARKNFSPKE